MKFTTLNGLALLLALLLTGPVSSQAQVRPSHHHGPDNPARREIQAYYQQQVLPAVRQQRQLLEPQLSAADQVLLARYRRQLQDLRQRGQALHEARKTQGGPGQTLPALNDTPWEQLAQLRADGRAIMAKVAELAEQYDAAIAPLLQALEPQKKQWSADVQAIVGKYATPEQQARLSHHGRHHGLGRDLRPSRFLLLDPATAAAPQPALGTTVYPNPTMATSQIDYNVAKAGAVTIELLDASGTRLRTIAQEASQEKGPHTRQVDVSSLPKGTYYYKIITRAGTETKRFVKE